MNINDAREQLHDLAAHAERCGSVTYLLDDNGNRLAAIVHHEIGEAWERTEAEEDQAWGEYSLQVSKEIASGEATTVPFVPGSTYGVDDDDDDE